MIYLNGNPVNTTRFPDNTTQVWKLPEFTLKESNWAHIVWEFTQEGEFLELAQLKTLLDYNKIAATLVIKYLPYGRQDKRVENNATFALRPFATLLNSLDFQEVFILDPHSSVATDLILKSVAVYPNKELLAVIDETRPDTLCYPDKGALSKYSGLPVYSSFRYIYGEKVRDQLTGNITKYDVIGNSAGKKVLIVDDICDGGMTFKLLASDLLAAGATEVNLFVTHGIFSKGLRTLKQSGISRIFTAKGECLPDEQGCRYRPYKLAP